jgi:hypothetical protein
MKRTKPKVKEKKTDKDNFDYMKTNKDNINNIIKDPTILPIINDLVNRTNKIVIHSYQFIKLYLIYHYDNNILFPVINKDFICDVFKVLTIRKCNKGGYTENTIPDKLKGLLHFYKTHYSTTISHNETIFYDKLSYILPYEAIDMTTNINNNIQEHFIDHLNKYVNIVFNIKEKSKQITKDNKDKTIRKELHKNLYDEIGKVKKDLIHFADFTSDQKYHQWIREQKTKLFPNKISFVKNSIHYDIKSNTQDYLISMFHISNELEKLNQIRIQNEEKQIRLFNVLPLRTNILGKNICIDTCALISNFLGDDPTSTHLKDYKKENNQYDLWNRFFKLNKRTFKKGQKYTFNSMIRTDGVSCCVLFVRVDTNGKPLKKTRKNKTCCEEENIDYIEKVELTDELRKMKVVCADPGMSDLIYCGAKDTDGKLQTFRYTQNQRRLETRLKKYNKLMDKISKETIIEDQTIKEIETELSVLNSKTCNYEKFKNYCMEKNKINYKLYSHYEQKIFRKFKLNRFTNTQKSEFKMVNNFSMKFGKPGKTIFVMGDHDKGSYHMKGLEPVISKKFRRIFRNAGYKTFLVNEFRTSKLCNCCNGELEYFLERPSQKPKRKRETEICHGILRCQSVKHKSEIFHNRDKNAVQNMLNIVKSVYDTGKRPNIFCRAVNS